MFFILSKVVYFLIQPLVWIVFFLIASLFSKNTIRKKKFGVTALVLLLFFSNQFIFNEISRAWENKVPPYSPTHHEQFDVAIILGGIVNYNNNKQQYAFYGNAERLFNVLPLYFNGTVKKILFAGGSGSLNQQTIEADIVKRYLLELGIAPEDIILEQKSRNTYENIAFALELLPSEDTKFLLSTSATHMPRALRIFHKKNHFPTPFPVDYESYEDNRFDLDNIIVPNPKVMKQWYWLIHEWVGILTYQIMGYC